MKKISKIKNPEIYQGSDKKSHYFEGWYLRHISSDRKTQLVIIPGVSYENKAAHSFIQIITGPPMHSYYIKYDISEFSYSTTEFDVRIGPNNFSKKGLHLEIDKDEINLKADIKYGDFTHIDSSFISPNIMGYFAYLRFMECYHGLISLNHTIFGQIELNGLKVSFDQGNGYIEKDWGRSFPQKYVWLQCNNFSSDISLFSSIAHIPFLGTHFLGFISVIKIANEQYRFATYNGAKYNLTHTGKDKIHIEFSKGNNKLVIDAVNKKGPVLKAPKQGIMADEIRETLQGNLDISFYSGGKLMYSGSGVNAGIEIVGF